MGEIDWPDLKLVVLSTIQKVETNIELSRYSGNMPVVNKQGWESPVNTIVKKANCINAQKARITETK